MTTTVIETCRITPVAGAAAELTVPLSFFDIPWVHYPPVRQVTFYHHPCSDADFLYVIVPKLKHSLSLALKHYLPIAANLLYPSDVDKSHPFIRHVSGDSVQLTIAVSSRDFDELTGSHARDSDLFYDFVLEMPPFRDEGEYKLVPLISLQATMFPGRGICIGVSVRHCVGDARSVVEFIWAWAEINKFDGDEEFLLRKGESLPLFDRSVLGDCGRINDIFWDSIKKIPLKQSFISLPTNRVRSSFTLHGPDIEELKKRVLSANRGLVNVSSFIVTAAYVWSCMVKSAAAAGEKGGGDEAEHFLFSVDARGRPNALVDPPVPGNYFGNLISPGKVIIERGKLAADDGFLTAAERIADEIKNTVNDKGNYLKEVDKWASQMQNFENVTTFGVSGSLKFDLLSADFGWGKGRSYELLSLDRENYFVLLSNSVYCDGGLDVGLSLPMDSMQEFQAMFVDGLRLVLHQRIERSNCIVRSKI